jgi:DNA-binding protein YbaB
MTVYEYPTYQEDVDRTQSVIARVERVQAMLNKFVDELKDLEGFAENDNGDVKVRVNHEGSLRELIIAQGCLATYDNLAFETEINETVAKAVDSVTAATAELTGSQDEADLDNVVAALSDPNSYIWKSA